MFRIIKKNKEEIIVVSIFMFFALGFNVYRVEGDGSLYYSFLEYFLRLPGPESFPNGYLNPGFQQAGCAYLNLPFYVIGYLLERLFGTVVNFNGITLRQIAINLASNFYMVISLVLAVKILKKFNFKNITLPILSVLFSTTAFSSAVIFSSSAHMADIFMTTVFIYLVLSGEDKNPKSNFFVGLVYVFMVLIRYLNFALILPLVVYFLILKEYKKLKFLLIGVISFIWILPVIFYVYNGNLFSPGLPGHAESLLSSVHLYPKYYLKLLLHPLHGLFIWSPVTVLSILGLWLMPKEKNRLGYLFFSMCLVFILLNGYLYSWYGGWTFSNRYLVSMFVIFIVGLAAFAEKYKKKAKLLIIFLTLFSLILYVNWRLNIIHGEFGTPGNMISAWRKAEAPASYDRKVNLSIVLSRLYETCRYKYIFIILTQ